MPAKPVISVKCPCCKMILEVDTRKERVSSFRKGRHLTDDAQEGEDSMDVAVRDHQDRQGRIEDDFLKAQTGLANQADRLNDLFEQAKDQVRDDDPEDDPDNPFAGGKKVWD